MCSFIASTLALMLRLSFINFHLRFRGPDHTGTVHNLGGFDFVHNLLHQTGESTRMPSCVYNVHPIAPARQHTSWPLGYYFWNSVCTEPRLHMRHCRDPNYGRVSSRVSD